MKDVRQWSCEDAEGYYRIELKYEDLEHVTYLSKILVGKSLFPEQVFRFEIKKLNERLCDDIFPLQGYGFGRR